MVPLGDMIIIVVNILIDLKILLILAICKLKIAQSIGCSMLDRGGYTVHLAPTLLIILESIINTTLGNSSQKDQLFIHGNDISVHPHIKGINQFLNPLIK